MYAQGENRENIVTNKTKKLQEAVSRKSNFAGNRYFQIQKQ